MPWQEICDLRVGEKSKENSVPVTLGEVSGRLAIWGMKGYPLQSTPKKEGQCVVGHFEFWRQQSSHLRWPLMLPVCMRPGAREATAAGSSLRAKPCPLVLMSHQAQWCLKCLWQFGMPYVASSQPL